MAPRRGVSWLTDCNFTVRRDKSFADDLVERPGRVRSRVALLLRATERKPDAALICDSPVIRGVGGVRGSTLQRAGLCRGPSRVMGPGVGRGLDVSMKRWPRMGAFRVQTIETAG